MHVNRIRRFGIVNAFLVPEDDGLTLVDTTLPRSAKAILDAASGLGAPIVAHRADPRPRRPRRLAGRARRARSPVSRCSSPRATRASSPATSRSTRTSRRASCAAATRRSARGRPGRSSPAERVGSLEVIAAPGHTPGHVALLDTRDRTLYCGDGFSTLGGVATTAKVNPRFPLPAMATWDKATELATARALRALDPARLAPGHGPVVENPGAAMDRAIARAS